MILNMRKFGVFRYFLLGQIIFTLTGCSSSPRQSPQTSALRVSEGTFESGDTLSSVLRKEGLPSSEAFQIAQALRPIFNPRKCRPGAKYELLKSSAGVIINFKYYPDARYRYTVARSSSGEFIARKGNLPVKIAVVGLKREIKNSLYETITEAGLSPEIALSLADVFAWQIDFFTECQNGDKFKLIWEREEEYDGTIREGKILVAQYGDHFAIGFQQGKKTFQYYSLDGKSLQKKFLRSPLNYRRISSYFSHRRFHPILRYWRPHLGIDYAAPVGTPVVSIGDGKIIYKGWRKDYGRFIKIRHNSVYTSTYGHLSRFAKRVKKGKWVSQGQVVGYVGVSGLTTGPHLDFRLIKNGGFINFLKLKLPPASAVKPEFRDEFQKIKTEHLTQLGSLFKEEFQPVENYAHIVERLKTYRKSFP